MEKKSKHSEISEEMIWDVVVVGGSLAGSSTAKLALQQRPEWKVAVVEKSNAFERRVGESTVEVSSYFLSHVLGLADHLITRHVPKQGLRFWLQPEPGETEGEDPGVVTFDQCSEIGGKFQVRIPAYQVDRAVLDEEALTRSVQQGVQLFRPWKACQIQLPDKNGSLGKLTIRCEQTGEEKTLQARWIVDGGGAGAWISNRKGIRKSNEAHPIGSMWGRYQGVRSFDCPELKQKYPKWARATHSVRSAATNHFVGSGWWAWVIPLQGGDCSLGIVYDNRKLTADQIGDDLPPSSPWGERVLAFLKKNHAVAREILRDAVWIHGDHHFRNRLSFYNETLAGEGYVTVGDASGFIDPFYSPGLDWLSFTVYSSVDLMDQCSRTECPDQKQKLLAQHNQKFRNSYRRWFEGVYRDKYDYINEFDLLSIAFRLDLGLYYLGVVSQPYLRGARSFLEPMFTQLPSLPVFAFMKLYNRRLSAIARSRKERGLAGSRNRKKNLQLPGFTFQPQSAVPMAKAVIQWIFIEITEGWRSWFSAGKASDALKIPRWAPSPSASESSTGA